MELEATVESLTGGRELDLTAVGLDEGMEMERRWHEDCKLMVPRRDLPALLTRACTQASGFEMLYQESKNRKETLSASFDGSPASVRAMTQP